VAFGVDACAELFRQAAATGADFVFVHHGLSWGDNFRRLRGITARRLAILFRNGISLYASHLPLDAHPEVGHNAVLAKVLGLTGRRPFFEYDGIPIGWQGRLPVAVSPTTLVRRLGKILNAECHALPGSGTTVRRVGIVSGGGADALPACQEAGLDCLITGELTHQHSHVLRETGVHAIVAGHYASETPGIHAVLKRVQKKYPVRCVFLDIPTGL
jgi:dinuclear metal center YbgI/SA1388 family protein